MWDSGCCLIIPAGKRARYRPLADDQRDMLTEPDPQQHLWEMKPSNTCGVMLYRVCRFCPLLPNNQKSDGLLSQVSNGQHEVCSCWDVLYVVIQSIRDKSSVTRRRTDLNVSSPTVWSIYSNLFLITDNMKYKFQAQVLWHCWDIFDIYLEHNFPLKESVMRFTFLQVLLSFSFCMWPVNCTPDIDRKIPEDIEFRLPNLLLAQQCKLLTVFLGNLKNSFSF